MLAIARGLMSEPRLILMDEPSMGLAPLIVQQIFEILKEINESGTTILLVDANGTTYKPDYDAMNIARQPKIATVPAEGRLEMDLWFDLPPKSIVRALRVGDIGKDIALPGT